MTVEPAMSVFRAHVKEEVGLQAHTRKQNRWFSNVSQHSALRTTVSILEHLNKNLRDNLQCENFLSLGMLSDAIAFLVRSFRSGLAARNANGSSYVTLLKESEPMTGGK
jgi:hypothetical protein